MVCQKSLLGNIHHLVSSKSIDLLWAYKVTHGPLPLTSNKSKSLRYKLPGVLGVDIPGSNSGSVTCR